MPGDGQLPHLLAWDEARANAPASKNDRVTPDARATLSLSELAVLSTAAHGLTMTESARYLGKGAETIKTQRGQIILKLGARNITHAVTIAVSRGILALDQNEPDPPAPCRGGERRPVR